MKSIPEHEIEKAIEKAFRIPGLYWRQDARFLYTLARRKGSFVEIGVWMGRTSAIMQQAAQVWGATLTSIDPFIPIKGQTESSPQRWAENLKAQGITPPALRVAPSAEVAQTWEQPLAMLFIDGAHDYAAVLADLRLWTPFLIQGGTVALHDMYGPLLPGVARAVNAWWLEEHTGRVASWECLGQVGLTIAFRKR